MYHKFPFMMVYTTVKICTLQVVFIAINCWVGTCLQEQNIDVLRRRRILTSVSDVFAAAPIPLFLAPNGLNELPEVTINYRKCVSNFLSSWLAYRQTLLEQANHVAHSNLGIKMGTQNKDFGTVSQTGTQSLVSSVEQGRTQESCYMSRWSKIIRVSVVLKRTVVESDWRKSSIEQKWEVPYKLMYWTLFCLFN